MAFELSAVTIQTSRWRGCLHSHSSAKPLRFPAILADGHVGGLTSKLSNLLLRGIEQLMQMDDEVSDLCIVDRHLCSLSPGHVSCRIIRVDTDEVQGTWTTIGRISLTRHFAFRLRFVPEL